MADGGGTITARFGVDGSSAKAELASVADVAQASGSTIAQAYGGASAQLDGLVEAARQGGRALETSLQPASDAADALLAKYRKLGEQFQYIAQQRASQASFNAQAAPGLEPSRDADGYQVRSAQQSASVFQDAFKEQEEGARAQAAAEREAAAAQAELTSRTNAYRSALEPLFAAELRRAGSEREATALLKAGTITQEQHAAGLRAAAAAYREEAAAAERSAVANGLSSIQYMELGHSVRAIADSLLAGLDPMRAVAMEAPRVGQALGSHEGGVAGGLSALASVAAPWAPLIAGVVALGALTFAAYQYGQAQKAMTTAITGLGSASEASVAQIQAIAEAESAAGLAGLDQARNTEVALLNSGKVGADALAVTTEAVQRYAKATGVDAKKATEVFTEGLADPTKFLEGLAEQMGLVDQKTIAYVRTLQDEGRAEAARAAAAAAINHALDTTGDHAAGAAAAWRGLEHAADDAWAAMERAAAHALGVESDTDKVNRLEAQRRQLRATPEGYQRVAAGLGGVTEAGIEAEEAPARSRLDQIARTEAERGRRQQAEQARQRYAALVPEDDKRQKLAGDRLSAAADLQAKTITPAQYAAELKSIDEQTKALDKSKEHHDRHAEALQRDSASLEANARGALASAQAYLQSSAAGVKADADRTAATSAAKSGADLRQRQEEQLALAIAQGAEAGAKSTRTVEDQTAARQRFDQAVASGQMTSREAEQALAREQALRPLLTLQTLAHGKAYDELTAIIQRYGAALKAANDEETHSKALGAHETANDSHEDAQEQLRLAALPKNDPARRTAARDAAERQARRQGYSPADVSQAGADAARANDDSRAGDQAKFVADASREYRQQNQLLTAQLAIVSMSAGQRAVILAGLREEDVLRQQGVSATGQEGAALIRAAQDQERQTQALQRALAAQDELRKSGEGLVDMLGQGLTEADNGWSSWLDAGMKAIQDVEQEFLKLALINPLKNQLFQENLPTLNNAGGVGGFFSSLFGRGAGAGLQTSTAIPNLVTSVPTLPSIIPGFAGGTDDAPPGWHWTGERGPELERGQGGEQILPHDRSMAVAAPYVAAPTAGGGGGGGGVVINDYRTHPSAAPAQARSTPGGGVQIDLRDQGKRAFRGYVQDGSFERDARGATTTVKKRA